MKALLIAGLLALPLGLCEASASAGSDPFNFLLLDAGARPAAMGGAYTALAAGADALFYNPAGLAGISRHEASFSHHQYVQGVTQDNLGYAAPQGLGFNVIYLDFGDVPRATISNPTGQNLGGTHLSELSAGAGYARAITESCRLGAAAKYLHEDIAGVVTRAHAFDAGGLCSARISQTARLGLGIAAQNFGASIKRTSGREGLPTNLRAGAAYTLALANGENTVSVDILKDYREKLLYGAGLEIALAKAFAVRLGYNSRYAASMGFTLGVGWRTADYSIDYAFVPVGALGYSQRVSISIRWGGGGSGQSAASPAPVPPPAPAPPPAPPTPPNPADEHLSRARALIEAQKFKAARAELEAAKATLEPGSRPRAIYSGLMGSLAIKEGSFREAKAWFLEGLSLAGVLAMNESAISELYLGLGNCLQREGDDSSALQAYLKALELKPSPKTRALIEKTKKKLGKE